MRKVPFAELERLVVAALRRQGASETAADATAGALVLAEADGVRSHGVGRAPAYLAQLRAGKVDGGAVPRVERRRPAHLHVDAQAGFAYPAIRQGLDQACEAVSEQGVFLLTVGNSHHAGVLGHAVEAVARRGHLALAFSNTPAAIAPWGGSRPLFGTNPIAFAAPRDEGGDPLVVDLSVSRVARGHVVMAEKRGEAIPEDWALDNEGRPTSDPARALGGSMRPMADAKGANLALMIEVLTAALTGSHFGFEASSFLDDEGAPPAVAQTFLLIPAEAPVRSRVDALLTLMTADSGVRIPGERRFRLREQARREGLAVSSSLLEELAHWTT